jgi:UDP-N-acetylmuramate-alanine ligase
MRVVVVGICGSGKSSLASGLRRLGYDVRECGQEHSEVAHMWQAISRPDVLVYLDASDEVIYHRGERHYVVDCVATQRQRLEHARSHCHLYVMTDGLTEADVLALVADFLARCTPLLESDLTGK